MGHRVRPDPGQDHLLLEPGAYGKHPVSGDWMACTPNGHLGNLKGHEVTEHEDGTITVYGHINRALVDVGQEVSVGEVIAEVGNRGRSTGPHLHFEAHSADGEKLDPGRWLDQRGVGF